MIERVAGADYRGIFAFATNWLAERMNEGSGRFTIALEHRSVSSL